MRKTNIIYEKLQYFHYKLQHSIPEFVSTHRNVILDPLIIFFRINRKVKI